MSIFHLNSFTRAETVAGMALAYRTYSTQIFEGWTISLNYASKVLDVPGYFYVLDIFSQQELPKEWSHLNNILLHQVLPTYTRPKENKSSLNDNYYNRNGDSIPLENSPPRLKKHTNQNYRKLADSIHGIKTTDSRLSHASPGAIESQSGRRNSNALPHDMRYYVYNHSAWTIQIRKEFITPSERIRTTLILNLIFHQIVTDMKEETNLRLSVKDRLELLSVIVSNESDDWCY
ncbi:unnamed protein product [Trichobilharzia regenti]|nr:unnamed protein product [Trichobilharzia regenti]